MPKSVFVLLSVLVLLAVAAPAVALPPGTDSTLNQYVVKATESYQDGPYPYLLNADYANYNGVTKDIKYHNRILLRANPHDDRSSYCVGITFEVLFDAMSARNRELGLPTDYFNGMQFKDLQDFVLDWYAAKGQKEASNIGVAVERYGIGQRVSNLEAALPGDFIDFTRANGSGHTAVFLEWLREDGRIIGIKYWSSQTSTNGIGVQTEYFARPNAEGSGNRNVVQASIIVARIAKVSNYQPFRLPLIWRKVRRFIRYQLQLAH